MGAYLFFGLVTLAILAIMVAGYEEEKEMEKEFAKTEIKHTKTRQGKNSGSLSLGLFVFPVILCGCWGMAVILGKEGHSGLACLLMFFGYFGGAAIAGLMD